MKVVREPGGEAARQPEGVVVRQTKFFQPTNQLQIQFVTDQGDLLTRKMEETRPVLRRSMLILLTKNSVLQIDQGNLISRKT